MNKSYRFAFYLMHTMKTFDTAAGLKSHLTVHKDSIIGFVPTMGALHKGHISIVSKAKAECPVVVVSIFVNPTQFNDSNDLARYPRTLEKDIEMLSKVLRDCDAVFTPSVHEVYPQKDVRVFDFGIIDKIMEGAHRPGHFNGVAQVVSRLFGIVEPDIAYFGEKDFQQLVIVRELVRIIGSRVRISGCPTLREPDGLAMSSRNMLLLPEHRSAAGIIYESLRQSEEVFRKEGIIGARNFFQSKVESVEGFRMQYYEVADDISLTTISDTKEATSGGNYHICVAVYAGEIRLIDNIRISLE
jgi:pantoate--beta-alanine ligase